MTLDDVARDIWTDTLDAVLITDPVRGLLIDANEAACAMFGLTLEALKVIDCLALRDPADPRWGQMFECRARTDSFRGELSWRRADGTVFAAEVTCSVLRGDGGMKAVTRIREMANRSARADRAVCAEPQGFDDDFAAVRDRLTVAARALRADASALGRLPDSSSTCWAAIAAAAADLVAQLESAAEVAVDPYPAELPRSRSEGMDAESTAQLAARVWRLATAVVMADAFGNDAPAHAIGDACRRFAETIEKYYAAGIPASRAESS